jgi:hypothetical protein
MSAYGSIPAPASGKLLSPRTYTLPSDKTVTVFHVRRDSDSLSPALFTHLHGVFNSVLAEGRTYPQRGPLDAQAFRDYYLAADLFLGLLDEDHADAADPSLEQGGVDSRGKTIQGVIGSREIASVVLGMYCEPACSTTSFGRLGVPVDPGRLFQISNPTIRAGLHTYISPLLPICFLLAKVAQARRNQICNGGFVVSPASRGLKVGMLLGRSYMHFAPLLGERKRCY